MAHLRDRRAFGNIGTRKFRGARFGDPLSPFDQGFSRNEGLQFFDHRGWPDVYPEETMTAYGLSRADGAQYIECDVQVLSDGSLAVIHDSTVDRTTTSTGNVSALNEIQFRALVADPSTYLGASWPDDALPMLTDVLDLYGNKVKLLLEVKSTGTAAPLLALLAARNISKDMVMINSFTSSYLTDFRSAGYITYLNYGTYSGTPSAEVDDGILFNHASNDPSLIAALQAEGLKAAPFTIDNYYQKRRFITADAMWTDQGGYLRGVTRRTTDPFADQKFYHGHIPCNSTGAFTGRGQFYGADEWGIDASGGWAGAVAGWANPLTGVDTTDGVSTVPEVTIDFEVKLNSADSDTRFGWMHISTTDDPLFTDAFGWNATSGAFNGSGYSFLLRKNGDLNIYRIEDGRLNNGSNANSPIATVSGVAISDGGTATCRITVTATNVKLERLDVPYSCNADNSDFRGGFLHHGFKAADGTFRNINIS